MPLEVVMLFGQLVILVVVERLAPGTRSIPERDLALGIQALELVENMATHWRHTRTTTNEDHFGVGVLGKEFAEGAHHRDLVARLQIEDISRHQSRRMIGSGRWRGDTDIELKHTLLFGVVRHGVSANNLFVLLVGNVE